MELNRVGGHGMGWVDGSIGVYCEIDIENRWLLLNQ